MGLVVRTTADEAAGKALIELQTQARAGLAEAREAITQLRAKRREEDDPGQIIQAFGQRMREIRPLDLHVRIALDFAVLPAELAESCSRILREALRNIELHANARRVDVELAREDQAIRLSIRDDGVGFEPSRSVTDHFGLVGMYERAASVGAKLEILSAPGEGAYLTLWAPIDVDLSTHP
jgi:signal transduction histidine kinase